MNLPAVKYPDASLNAIVLTVPAVADDFPPNLALSYAHPDVEVTVPIQQAPGYVVVEIVALAFQALALRLIVPVVETVHLFVPAHWNIIEVTVPVFPVSPFLILVHACAYVQPPKHVELVEHVTLPYIQFETANEPVMTVSPNWAIITP